MRKLLVWALLFGCNASGIPSSTTPDLATASDLSRKGGVGSACLTDEQCSTPKCLGDPMWPGSYCTTLKFDCTRDNVCPSGSVCGAAILRGSPPVDVCLDLCNSDDDCRRDEGYGCCLHDNGSEVCLPLVFCR